MKISDAKRRLRLAPAMLLALGALACVPSRAFVLEDTYGMASDQRIWYFGGVFDAALIDPRTSECANRLGFAHFMQALSRFVSELPADTAAPLRRGFDRMPAAAVAQLVMEGECRR